MKMRSIGLAVVIGLLLVHGITHADTITSGSASRVGEPQNLDKPGRAQVKVCGVAEASTSDLQACTFQLTSLGFTVGSSGGIEDLLTAKRGSKATTATFQSDPTQRPTLTAKLKQKQAGIVFCISVDRALLDAPPDISTEPCLDGEEAVLTHAFTLSCADGDIEFEQDATWRVPTSKCPQDFPKMRTP
jgi:hypothetical protein